MPHTGPTSCLRHMSPTCIATRLQAEQHRLQLAAVQQQAARQRQQLAARCEALDMAGGALVRCLGRLADAQGRLAGEDGAGLWRAMHSKLVARQNRVVGAGLWGLGWGVRQQGALLGCSMCMC